jgi:hypothetical protein
MSLLNILFDNGLQVFQKLIVISVGADPTPNHRVAVERAHGTVADSDAGRIGRRIAPDLFRNAARGDPGSAEKADRLLVLDAGRTLAASRRALESAASCENS